MALDVSNKEVLSCWRDSLTAIDLSNNTELYYLALDDNQLKTLDVSNNNKLTSLYCSENQLMALDLDSSMKFDHLSYSPQNVQDVTFTET